MAARRLLVAMLIFLAISTVLAALAPRPTEPDRTEKTTTTTQPTPTPPARGELVRRSVSITPGRPGTPDRPARVTAQQGDQLALTITSPRIVTIEIPSLGLTETTGPDDPARLDLYLASPGRHVARDADTGRQLFVIESAREHDRRQG